MSAMGRRQGERGRGEREREREREREERELTRSCWSERQIKSLKNFITLVKASLWLREHAARAHWISVRDTALDRKGIGQR